MQLNKLFKNPFTRNTKPALKVATAAKTAEASNLPTDSASISETAEVAKPAKKKSNWRSGGIAKTALALGLAASLAMGMMGCTTMQTTCTPTHCVTQEVIDPVGTGLAIGAGAIILDAVLEDAHHDGGYYHDHGGYEHYHEYGGYHSHDGGYYYNQNY